MSVFSDAFGDRVPRAVSYVSYKDGVAVVPVATLDAASDLLAGLAKCCPLGACECPQIEEVCRCSWRRATGFCDPASPSKCWADLAGWLGDPSNESSDPVTLRLAGRDSK